MNAINHLDICFVGSSLLGTWTTKHKSVFARLISHQPAVFFSQNEPATSNQAAVLFSQNKPALATSQPNRLKFQEQSSVTMEI
jgi:hypothetical protein